MNLIKLRNSLPSVIEFRDSLPTDRLIFFDTELTTRSVEEERTQWLFVLPTGSTVYVDPETEEKHEIDLSEGFLSVSANEFRRATFNFREAAPKDGTPYTFPALKEHKPDGERFGDLLDAKISGEGDKHGLYIKVKWSEPTWKKIQKEEYKFVSVRIDQKYTDELGNEYGPIIKEVSLTANPRIKRIGSIQDTLTFSDGDGMTKEELERLIDERAEAKAKQMLKAAGQAPPADTEPDEAPPADAKPEEAPPAPAAPPADTNQPESVALAEGSNTPKGWDSDDLVERIVTRMSQRFESDPSARNAAMRFADLANGTSGGGPKPPTPTPKTPDLCLAEAIKEGLEGEEAVISALENYDTLG